MADEMAGKQVSSQKLNYENYLKIDELIALQVAQSTPPPS